MRKVFTSAFSLYHNDSLAIKEIILLACLAIFVGPGQLCLAESTNVQQAVDWLGNYIAAHGFVYMETSKSDAHLNVKNQYNLQGDGCSALLRTTIMITGGDASHTIAQKRISTAKFSFSELDPDSVRITTPVEGMAERDGTADTKSTNFLIRIDARNSEAVVDETNVVIGFPGTDREKQNPSTSKKTRGIQLGLIDRDSASRVRSAIIQVIRKCGGSKSIF